MVGHRQRQVLTLRLESICRPKVELQFKLISNFVFLPLEDRVVFKQFFENRQCG